MLSGPAATCADRIVSELGIVDAKDLQIEDIAWQRGALVRYDDLDSCAARLVVLERRAVITVSTRLDDPGQRNFAAAHELGHLELHRATSDLTLCRENDLDFRAAYQVLAKADREGEANTFAGALLLPTPLLEPLIAKQTPSMALVSELASIFPASFTATAIRYVKLAREPCAIVYSRDRRICWYVASKDFDFHVRVHEELDLYSAAYDFFDGRPLSGRMTEVDASCWLAPGRYRDDALIKEDSRGFPRQNATLSLLWMHKDIEREWEPRESFTSDGKYRRR